MTPEQRSTSTGIPVRALGRTGEFVSLVGLGGWHARMTKDDREAVRLIHEAVDQGMTFLDNCWDYHDGAAEELYGKALSMDGYRDKAFLMTKVCDRDYEGAKRHLEDSLRRMRTDRIDLWQFHEMVYDNDPDWVFEHGGIRAALEAREQGKVRYIGFTGHKDPRIHVKMLGKPHDWDAAQMPIGIMDYTYRSFLHEVVPVCQEKGVGVVGMKAAGGMGQFIKGAGLSPEECYRFALSQPVSVQVVGVESDERLQQILRIARNFQPMSEQEQQDLVRRTALVAGDGRFEEYKSTKNFDGPHHREQHGFALAGA